MVDSLLQPADRKTVATMQSERMRMRAELTEGWSRRNGQWLDRAPCSPKSTPFWPEKNCRS